MPHKTTSGPPTLADRIRRLPFTPLQLAIHVGTWGELGWIAFDFFTHRLTVNPLQDIQLRTGRIAITLLVLSLACTPLSNLLGWRELPKRSRTLGLYAFMVAFLHVLVFLDLNNGIAWNYFADTIVQKPYILFGIAAFLMLIPLAMTSFDIWKARLGKRWKRLHQFVYLIVPVAVLHYALAVKGDVLRLSGNILTPLIYAGFIALLLILRLPFVRRFFVGLRNRVRLLVSSRAAPKSGPAPSRHAAPLRPPPRS